jgi:hypothetical protein
MKHRLKKFIKLEGEDPNLSQINKPGLTLGKAIAQIMHH